MPAIGPSKPVIAALTDSFSRGFVPPASFVVPCALPPFPNGENCTFYQSAGAAQKAGYRPCLRCRPEMAPQVWSTADGADIVPQALRLIGAGVLDEGSVTGLAQRLGVSNRYLRRRFAEDLGTAPSQVAKTRRLLFAKQLITDTPLTMTEIAIAAGFQSIRSFNRAVQQTYGCAPTDLRRHRQMATTAIPITLKLPFSPPYNWAAIAAFRQGRATPGFNCRNPPSLLPYDRTRGTPGLDCRRAGCGQAVSTGSNCLSSGESVDENRRPPAAHV